jgi:multiple sugar transport system permease protein
VSTTSERLARPRARARAGRPGPRVGDLAAGALVLAWAALAMLPLVWMLSTALKRPEQVFAYPPQPLPIPLDLEHYAKVLRRSPFPRFFLNSLVVGICVAAGQIVSSALAA